MVKNKVDLNALDSLINNLEKLSVYEKNAEDDLKKVENLDRWQSTPYENTFLPALRLAGVAKNDEISLLNQADLHVHTQWSDGDDLDKVLDVAVSLGLDAIAITDHDVIDGAFEARRRAHQRRLKIAVVPGIEVSSKDGHIGGLFMMKTVPEGLSAAETVDLIHKAGGIAVAHHPYTPPIIDKLFKVTLGCRDLIKEVPFDAIECTNAVPGYGSKYNMDAYASMRKNKVFISMTGSSDAHYAGFVGKGRTFYAGNRGVDSLNLMLKLGFTRGAESYWRFSEKLRYRTMLYKGVLKGIFKSKDSVN
jgi:predicted metal-dependent phosphoesterase TrpH